MTTARLILLDHAVALLDVVAWFGTGVAAALRRHRLARALLLTALLVTLARIATVSVLAGRGWWFVAEKALLGLPLLGVAAVIAALVAGPRLWTAKNTTGERLPARCVVVLLTPAYAALAGLLVTFLAGYPLTWSTALMTVALVSAGAALTARVLAREADGEEAREPTARHTAVPRPAVPRRRFVGLAAGAGVVGLGGTGVGLLFRSADPVVTGGGPAHSSGARQARSVAGLRGPAEPAPGGALRRYTLTARRATVRLASGREIDAWTYDGRLPGPALTATEGDLIEVTLRNSDIQTGVTAHWHGYDVPCGEDGVPDLTQRPVEPGEEFVYRFRADQVGTYWYHTHEASDPAVRKGLYGTLVVTPREGSGARRLDLTLPVHTFAGTVAVGDRDGRTTHTAAPGTEVRLRLVNTDSDPHRLALTGTRFRLAAVDGRDLEQPQQVRDVALRLAAGGRHDLEFVMPDTAVALVLDDDPDTGVLLRPDDAEDEPAIEDTSDWPELDLLRYGTPTRAPFDPDAADRHFTLVLDRALAMVDGRPAYAQTVDGRGHPSIPDLLVAEGDVVRFTVVNRSLETHPWHLHGHPVLVLSRDGRRASGSPLWTDTFDVRPGEVWEVAFRADNPGMWMNHCHNLPHAEQGMMLRVVYDGFTTPFGDAHAGHGA
ncbi:multicopper oxidase family protein [Streptomyces roseirectus]|uniref:Multicopper oxidase family protein n=1 Tax=Streptomyces roseirectus TaxID=2768066 RepID=A0A7H0IPM1_9ACTN|nr:multicopper oxidase family protein [Streptomyces roseirectus]QNP74737.1 multicopper oxidase family protein [Streptomyces roseirectus]